MSADESPQPSRRRTTRTSNDRIADSAALHHFGRDVRVPFMCECGDEACAELVPLTLPAFSRLRATGGDVLAPGH